MGIAGATYQKFFVPKEITSRKKQLWTTQKPHPLSDQLPAKGTAITTKAIQTQ
jgi:hypothetical protein